MGPPHVSYLVSGMWHRNSNAIVLVGLLRLHAARFNAIESIPVDTAGLGPLSLIAV